MKKAKRIYALLGVLAVVCIATFVLSRHEEEKEKIKNSDEIILTLDQESVTALSWEYEEISLAFHKDETWLYDADEAFPVDEEKIAGLLEQFVEFGVSFEIEEVEDYSQYGLDDPVCTISITADEQEYCIQLGAYSTMDEERYVSLGDGKVYLVSHDPMEDYEIELKDMIRDDEVPALSEATAIRFSGAENYEIDYKEESTDTYCADDVYFMENKPLDTTLVSSYLKCIDGVNLSEYVSYNVSEEELAEFGLEGPDLTIEVDYTLEAEDDDETLVEQTFVLHIACDQEELDAAKESEDEEALAAVAAYARVGDSQIIYQITASEYEELIKCSYDDLRHKEVLTADFADIYQIDVTLEDVSYTLSTTLTEETDDAEASENTAEASNGDDEDSEEVIWYYQSEELDMTSLKAAVYAIKAESFTAEEPVQKEEISFTVYLDNEYYPEIKVQLYRYDGECCLAVVDDTPVSLVPRSQVVDLMEAVNSIVLK